MGCSSNPFIILLLCELITRQVYVEHAYPCDTKRQSSDMHSCFPSGHCLLLLQSKLLSDFSFPAPMQMRQPPRIIPPALLKDVRQVEFVGYVANPMYKRGAAPGEATKAVAALRNMRHQPKQASLNAAANAARTRHALARLTFHVCLSMRIVLPAASHLAFT
jgi:hypothetical protein